jgi:hypothetical protein
MNNRKTQNSRSGIGQKLLLLLSPVILTMCVMAQDKEIQLRNFDRNEIQYQGFTLNRDKTLIIEAVGAGGDKVVRRTKNYFVDPQNLFVYAWILDARSREIKWRMTVNNTESGWWEAKYNRKFEGEVDLAQGEYELYCAAFEPLFLSGDDGYFSLKRLWEKVFGDENWWRDNSENWTVVVKNVDEEISQSAIEKYQRAVKKSAIVALTQVGDAQELKKGFTLKKDAVLNIYAIGEGDGDEMYDYAYIVDADSRERIWIMDTDETEHAGGALKNRMIREKIAFEKGNYLVYYQSDDSHSYEDWNSNPPYDPSYWGVTVTGASADFDKNIIYKFEESEGDVIVKLDRLGDYEEVYQGFSIDRAMKVRIYAIGEGRNGEMFDYGWIENARNRRKVWEMDYRSTEQAGGDDKNRRYDGVVLLEKGSYLAYFITDDSHSYRDWNAKKPLDPAAWGLKIFTVNKGDEKYVKKYEPDQDENIIAQIIRVGDDEHMEKKFTLKQDTDIRIYALGEGGSNEMYDYGWIESSNTGRIVWEMRYRDTRRAGGASKNRLIDTTIRLKKGSYILHYVSDDSHSYGDWNDDPPRDRRNWGIVIFSTNGY